MSDITLESIKEKHDELGELIAKLEAQWSKPKFFEYLGERIALNPGETYVGTITTPGEYGSYHLILLPDASDPITWKEAMDWADELGGELPNRVESALLFATQKTEFEDAWYWTRESYSDANAWVQHFHYGHQHYNRKCYGSRARAVRRLVFQ